MDIIFFIFLLLLPWPLFILAQRSQSPGNENYNIYYFLAAGVVFITCGILTITQEHVIYYSSEIQTIGENVTSIVTTHYFIGEDQGIAFLEMSVISFFYFAFGVISLIFGLSEVFSLVVRRDGRL